MAGLIRDYKFSYAPYSATSPTTWIELKNCIRSLANPYAEADSVDTTTIDNHNATSIEGMGAGDAVGYTVYVNREFLAAHEAMVTEMDDVDKGYFWIQIEVTNRNLKYTFPATCVRDLPLPEGDPGSIDEITWNVYVQDDIVKSTITP